MILSKKKTFFKNSEGSDISPQIIEFKNLEDSALIFQALEASPASLTSVVLATSLASTASKAKFSQKKRPGPDGLIIPSTKMTNTGPFLWNG